jgi:hypothetical protein
MSGPRKALSGAAAVALAMLAAAFAAAPHSCNGGLEVYVGVGIVALIVMAALPFVIGPRDAPAKVSRAFGFVALGIVVWLAGGMVANVRIMCRLF